MADFIPDPTVMAATTIAGLDGQVEAAITAAYNVDGKQARTGVTFDFRKVPKHHTYVAQSAAFVRYAYDWRSNAAGSPVIIDGTDRPPLVNVTTANEFAYVIEKTNRLNVAAHFPVPQWQVSGSATPRVALHRVSFSFEMPFHPVALSKGSTSTDTGARQYDNASQIAREVEIRIYAVDTTKIRREARGPMTLYADHVDGDSAAVLVASMMGVKMSNIRQTVLGNYPSRYEATVIAGAAPGGLFPQQVTYLTPDGSSRYRMERAVFHGVITTRHMVGGAQELRPNTRLLVCVTASERLLNAGEDFVKDNVTEGSVTVAVDTDRKRTPLLPVIGGVVWPIWRAEWCQ